MTLPFSVLSVTSVVHAPCRKGHYDRYSALMVTYS